MSLTSLEHLLEIIAKQPKWDEYRRYLEICDIWPTIAPKQAVSESQPLYVQRDMLWIAVSSSVWAQQLSFQSYSLLQQLNHHLSGSPLQKLRFSPAQWHPHYDQDKPSSSDHIRSFFSFVDQVKPSPQTSQTPEEAFQRWTNAIAQHLDNLPLCPQCHCRTPAIELERWSKCYLCVTQHWQTKSLSNLE